jgi:hypothetical protein
VTIVIFLSCDDFARAGIGADVACCTSCHGDDEDGYAPLCSRDVAGREGMVRYDIRVCCAKVSPSVPELDDQWELSRATMARTVCAWRKRQRL